MKLSMGGLGIVQLKGLRCVGCDVRRRKVIIQKGELSAVIEFQGRLANDVILLQGRRVRSVN